MCGAAKDGCRHQVVVYMLPDVLWLVGFRHSSLLCVMLVRRHCSERSELGHGFSYAGQGSVHLPPDGVCTAVRSFTVVEGWHRLVVVWSERL